MPPFQPQALPVFPGNANVANALVRAGESFASGANQRRNRNALTKVSDVSAAGGDVNALARAQIESGIPQLQQAGINALARAKEREEDVAFRDKSLEARQSQQTQAQSNADRAFQARRADSARDFSLRLRAIDAKAARLTPILTKGEEATDKAFAKDFVEFNSTGGFADTSKQIQQLEGVINDLRTDDNLTGPIRGNVPDAVGAFSAQGRKAINTRERVEEVVQRNLRLILGAQFTQKEGERLIARAFNPLLEEGENIRRVQSLIQQMKIAAEQKKAASEYFEQNGTLKGFRGKIPSFSDFSAGPSSRQPAAQAVPTVSTPQEASQLPSGTQFRDPNGVLRIVP